MIGTYVTGRRQQAIKASVEIGWGRAWSEIGRKRHYNFGCCFMGVKLGLSVMSSFAVGPHRDLQLSGQIIPAFALWFEGLNVRRQVQGLVFMLKDE